MANKVVFLFSIALVCITATNVKSHSVIDHNYQSIDGICQTMVEPQGYRCEEHMVETKDGYFLSLQRLPAGRSGKGAYKPPVLLQHGLFCDAVTWLVNSPDASLGFILADSGYDVWLANTRGTKLSRKHISLQPTDMAYWDWSWDELASYDLPAFVNYVHNLTSQRMHYAGHSLGTLMALTAFSQGQVLDMLRSAALLSPIAHMHLVSSPIARFAADTFLIEHLYLNGLREFVPNSDVVGKMLQDICIKLNLDCSKLLALFTGPNCCLNSSTIDAFLHHGIQSTATMNLIHLCQMIRTGTIAKYDYGNPALNIQHYGQPVPPLYDMTKIPKELPLFLGYGGLDMLSDVKDVQFLLNDLQNHKTVVLLKQEYAHVDFFMAGNVKQIIYDPLMAFFQGN